MQDWHIDIVTTQEQEEMTMYSKEGIAKFGWVFCSIPLNFKEFLIR